MGSTNREPNPKSFLVRPGPNETAEEFTARLIALLRDTGGSANDGSSAGKKA